MPDHRDRTLPRIQTRRSSNLNSKNPTKSVIALRKGPKVDANKSKSLHIGDEYYCHELDRDRAQTRPHYWNFPRRRIPVYPYCVRVFRISSLLGF